MRLLRLRVFRRVSRILIPSYGAFAWSHALRSITHSSTKRLFLDASWKDKANVNVEERMARATCVLAAQCTQSSLSLASQQWYARALSLVFQSNNSGFMYDHSMVAAWVKLLCFSVYWNTEQFHCDHSRMLHIITTKGIGLLSPFPGIQGIWSCESLLTWHVTLDMAEKPHDKHGKYVNKGQRNVLWIYNAEYVFFIARLSLTSRPPPEFSRRWIIQWKKLSLAIMFANAFVVWCRRLHNLNNVETRWILDRVFRLFACGQLADRRWRFCKN